jgi:hypothetical protein
MYPISVAKRDLNVSVSEGELSHQHQDAVPRAGVARMRIKVQGGGVRVSPRDRDVCAK